MSFTPLPVPGGFTLDRLGPQDKAALVLHMNDPEVARNLLLPPFPYSGADAEEWIAIRASIERDPECHFVIRDAEGFMVGSIGTVEQLTEGSYRTEIGYWLARDLRGRSIMPAALRVYAAHAFGALGLHRLQANPFTFNISSQRALEKAGFTREGCLRAHYRKNGAFLDAFVYGLLAQESYSNSQNA